MNDEAALPTHTAGELLQDAAQWRLIGLLLECPRADWFVQVAAVAAEVDNEQLRRAAELARQEASEGLYHTTFGPGGPAAPREVSYHDSLVAGQTLAQLRAQYAAFGFTPSSDEAPDHIAVEAGFVAYLRLKEAYALHAGDTDKATVAREAASCFIRDRLSAIAGPFAESLESSGIGYLTLVADALRKTIMRRLCDHWHAGCGNERSQLAKAPGLPTPSSILLCNLVSESLRESPEQVRVRPRRAYPSVLRTDWGLETGRSGTGIPLPDGCLRRERQGRWAGDDRHAGLTGRSIGICGDDFS